MTRKDSDQHYDHLIKILLVGDSSVGKSSLLLRYCNSKFSSAFTVTIGVNFKSQIIQYNGRRYKLQIWDTAGQERFRTITPAYYKSAMGVVLVYDTTSLETFENLNYWIESLENCSDSESTVKILVGNKTDNLQSARQVSEQKGRNLAQVFGIPFFEISAKDNTGVEEIFNRLAEMIIESDFFQNHAAKKGATPRRRPFLWRALNATLRRTAAKSLSADAVRDKAANTRRLASLSPRARSSR